MFYGPRFRSREWTQNVEPYSESKKSHIFISAPLLKYEYFRITYYWGILKCFPNWHFELFFRHITRRVSTASIFEKTVLCAFFYTLPQYICALVYLIFRVPSTDVFQMMIKLIVLYFFYRYAGFSIDTSY